MIVPNEVLIELTQRCNLACDFCFNKQENKPPDPPLERIARILEDIKDSKINAVRFTGGEPLLREDIKEVLKQAKELGLYVILNTNSSLINEKNKQSFRYVDLALFSLHSPSRFSETKEKISALKEFPLKILLGTITTKRNITNLGLFYGFVCGLEQDNLEEWFLLRQVPNKQIPHPLSLSDMDMLFEEVSKYNKRYGKKIQIANALPFCTTKQDWSSICKGGIYDSGYSRLIIDCKGQYRTDYFSAPLGNIKHQKIMDIWNLPGLKKLRDYGCVPDECKKCYYLHKCKGGLVNNEPLYGFDNVGCLASIVIPTFNGPERLGLLIKSLENQTCNNFEIVVVDDGSTDNTKSFVEGLINESKLDIRYFYLDNTDIFGAGIARNYGAKQARGKILIFLDQDNIVHPNLVANHLHEQEDKDVVLGYYAGYGNKNYHYDLAKLKKLTKSNKTTKTIIPEFRDKIFKEPNNFREGWEFFVSANFSIKKEIFLNFLFDENIVSWGAEDTELGYRLVKHGHPLFFCKECFSINTSEGKIFDRKKFVSSTRGLVYSFHKHNSEKIKEYCFERFNNTPAEIRGNAKLIDNGDKLVFNPPTRLDRSTGLNLIPAKTPK